MKDFTVTSWSAGWSENGVTLFNLEGTRCAERTASFKTQRKRFLLEKEKQ